MRLFSILLLSVLLTAAVQSQNPNKKFSITGKVTDVNNKPVSGALILLDGKNTTVITDEEGMYKLKVRPDNDSITIVTFNTGIRTTAINGQTVLNFKLGGSPTTSQKFNTNPSGQEQVNIGYGSVDQKNLVTPVSSIDARNSKYATYKDVYEILRGTPGVTVSGKSIKIQGAASFNLSTEPLYIVDGMALESIDGVIPAMIDNISVLKGASTAIYGSRGANGVILITLIKGDKK